MINLKSRGQAAMEYLTTYGWAILVVMVVGIAMWRMGIFSASSTAPMTFTGFGKIKPQLSGTGMNLNGDFIGVFTNTMGTTLTITRANITNMMKKTSCLGLDANGNEISDANPLSIISGDNFLIQGHDCGIAQKNEVFVVTVILDYSVSIGDATTSHTESGTIRGSYEG